MSYYIFEKLDYVSTDFLTKIIKQIKVYNKLKENTLQLYKEQRNKMGVCCFINLINSYTYISSSTNIEGRIKDYLNNSYIKANKIIKFLLY